MTQKRSSSSSTPNNNSGEGWWIFLSVIDVGKSVARVIYLTVKNLSK
jgi:hypothetical protein